MEARAVVNLSMHRYFQERHSIDTSFDSSTPRKSFLPMIIKSSNHLQDAELPLIRSSLESISITHTKPALKSYEIDDKAYKRYYEKHFVSISPRNRIYPSTKRARLKKIGLTDKPDSSFESENIVLPSISPVKQIKATKLGYLKPSYYKKNRLSLNLTRDYKPKMVSIAIDTEM